MEKTLKALWTAFGLVVLVLNAYVVYQHPTAWFNAGAVGFMLCDYYEKFMAPIRAKHLNQGDRQ